MQQKIFVNNQIGANEVRLIDETGKQLGVVQLSEALSIAQGKGLDVIQVTEKVTPPVCKLGNYGKYLYQLEKKERQTKKQVGGDIKEVRLTFNISPHDMETRATQAVKFLARGDKVRLTVRLRGREKAMRKFVQEKVQHFLELLKTQTPIKIESELRVEPRGLSMIIAKQ